MLRACGVNIRSSELNRLIQKSGIKLKIRQGRQEADGITFEDFEKMYEYQSKEGISNSEIQDALASFDKNGSGKVSLSELEHVLTHCAEKIPKRIFDDFVAAAKVDAQGSFDYRQFLKDME